MIGECFVEADFSDADLHTSTIRPINSCVTDIFKCLKDRCIKIGVYTSDNRSVTEKGLTK